MEQFLEKSWITITVLILVVIGGLDLALDNTLSGDYERLVETVGPMLGLTAIGRGAAVYAKRR